MKREPNPYLKNPRLTVTNTMSISVPSMVAEDVLDGPDTSTIIVDPEVNGRIDSVSEVVDLMDTRIDAVSEVANLTNTNLYNLAEVVDVINTRVDTVSKVASLGDAILTKDQLKYNGLGDAATAYQAGRMGLTNTNSGQVYDVMTVKDSKTKAVYPIAALGFVCPATNNTGIYWQKTDQAYDLQFTKDGGKSWTSLTGNSTGETYLPVVGSVNSLCLYSTRDNTSTWEGYTKRASRVFKFGPDDTAIVYGLQTALAAIGTQGQPGTQVKNAGATQMALVQGDSSSSEPHFVWWSEGNSTWNTWEPWKEAGGAVASDTAKYLLGTNDSQSAIVPLIKKENLSYVSWGIANPSSPNDNIISGIQLLTTNAIGTYSEVGPYTNATSINGRIVPKYTNGDLSWCYSADGWNWQEISTGSNTVIFGPFQPSGSSTQYELSLALNTGRSDAYSAVVELRDKTNDYPGDAALSTYLAAPNESEYNRAVLMAVSGMGALVFKDMGRTVKYDLNNLGGAGESSTPSVSFRTPGGTNYTLEFEVDSTSNDWSAIVELTSAGSNTFSGIAALGTWLSTPSSLDGRAGTCMAVSGMGTLIFKHMNDTVTYDLNNLGGAGDSTNSKLQINPEDASDEKTLIVTSSTTYSSTVMSLQLYSSRSKTSQLYAIAAPWFASSNSTNYGMRIVPDSDLSSMIELTTNGGSSWNKLPWPTIGEGSSGSNSGPVYELGLLTNGADSGSHMVPLVTVTSDSLGNGKALDAVKWSIGASTQDANDLSGVYTLMANPLALFGHFFDSIDDMHITGAIRPMLTSEGTLAWQKLNYTTKQWESITGDVASAEGSLPEGVTMELLPFSSYYGPNVKGRLAQFTSTNGTLLATAPGIGLYNGSESIVACLSNKSVDTSTNKTTWQSSYATYPDSTDNNHNYMDITELIKRRQQLCDIAGHLSQIKWLCENAANIESLLSN